LVTRREGGEELRLLEGQHVRKVKVTPRASESPRRRVVRARGQLRCVVGAKGETKSAGEELGVEGSVGARVNAAEARGTTAHPGKA
jgi:hypothetical protein